MRSVNVPAGELKTMIARRLAEGGLPAADCRLVADVLVFAELRGVASHGAVRVEHYVSRMRQGGINLAAKLEVDFLRPAMGKLDAQGAMGHVASVLAMQEAIRAARTQGAAVVGVHNSSHNGALAYYAQMALDEKMASLSCVNVDRLVVPFGGRFSFLGSNPMAFGYPGRKEDILLDMATSEVAWGKIINAKMAGQSLPPGVAQDVAGAPTTDPGAAVSLTPFGGAKGYAIGVMLEALTGLLVGGVFGPHLAKMYEGLTEYRNLSGFYMVINPAVMWGSDAYLDCAQQMIDEIHAATPGVGFERVMIPGEIERNNATKFAAEGIPVPEAIYKYLAG